MRYSVFLALLFIPSVSQAAIIFSEIAWMGTTADANNEWIELYNHDAGDVSVDGWSISDGVSLNIPLAGTIPGRTIVLLERTDDDSVPGVTAFLIYTGALSNEGRTLTLKRADGSTEDQVVGGENWANIGGDNVTKKTPQGTMTGWVTGTPTPGAPNVEHDADADTDTNDDTNNETDVKSTTKPTVTKSTSGGSGKPLSLSLPAIELALSISAPKTVYVNAPTEFEVLPRGLGETAMNSLQYSWNFGDTYTASGTKAIHRFEYPGTYLVTVSGTFARHHAVARHEVTVVPVMVALARTPEGNLTITNNSSHELDLAGYTMKGDMAVTMPPYSILLPGRSLVVSRDRLEATGGGERMIALYDPETTLVTSLVPNALRAAPATLAKTATVKPVAAAPARPALGVTKAATMSEEPTPEPAVVSASAPLIIPIGTAQAASAGGSEVRSFQSFLPYVGLLLLMIISSLLLYPRVTRSRSDSIAVK